MISDILLVDFSSLNIFEANLSFFFFELAPFFVALGLLLELMLDGDGGSVIKRTLTGFIIATCALAIQVTLVKSSFELADRAHASITEGRPTFFGGKDTKLLFLEYKKSLKEHANKEDSNKGFLESIVSYARFATSMIGIGALQHTFDSILIHATRLATLVCFVFVKVAYTSIFILNLFLIPFPALVSILPFSKSSSTLPISTLLWLMIQPFTLSAILLCMDIMLADAILTSTKSGSGIGLETCVMLLCFSVMLVATIGITASIIHGTGITQAIAQSSMIVPLKAMEVGKLGAAVMTKGASFLGSGKLMNLGSNLSQMTSSKLSDGKSRNGLSRGLLRGTNALAKGTASAGGLFQSAGSKVSSTKQKLQDSYKLDSSSYGEKYLADGSSSVTKAHGVGDSVAPRPARSPKSEVGYSASIRGVSSQESSIQNKSDLSASISRTISENKSSGAKSIHPIVKKQIESCDSAKELNDFACSHEGRISRTKNEGARLLIRQEANLARERAQTLIKNNEENH